MSKNLCILLSGIFAFSISNSTAGVQRTHPYLYFTSSTVSTLQAKLDNGPFAARWTRFIANANGHLSRATYGFDNTREALGVAGICAFAYVLTNDAQYATRAIEEALALMDASAWHTGYSWNQGDRKSTRLNSSHYS